MDIEKGMNSFHAQGSDTPREDSLSNRDDISDQKTEEKNAVLPSLILMCDPNESDSSGYCDSVDELAFCTVESDGPYSSPLSDEEFSPKFKNVNPTTERRRFKRNYDPNQIYFSLTTNKKKKSKTERRDPLERVIKKKTKLELEIKEEQRKFAKETCRRMKGWKKKVEKMRELKEKFMVADIERVELPKTKFKADDDKNVVVGRCVLGVCLCELTNPKREIRKNQVWSKVRCDDKMSCRITMHQSCWKSWKKKNKDLDGHFVKCPTEDCCGMIPLTHREETRKKPIQSCFIRRKKKEVVSKKEKKRMKRMKRTKKRMEKKCRVKCKVVEEENVSRNPKKIQEGEQMFVKSKKNENRDRWTIPIEKLKSDQIS